MFSLRRSVLATRGERWYATGCEALREPSKAKPAAVDTIWEIYHALIGHRGQLLTYEKKCEGDIRLGRRISMNLKVAQIEIANRKYGRDCVNF